MLLYLLVFIKIDSIASQLWDKTNSGCPTSCTCQLEHLTETAIFRFIQNNTRPEDSVEVSSTEFNDVLYHDTIDASLFQDKPIVRSAICILQKEMEPSELIKNLPEDIEALTLIQGYDTGNKSVRFSLFEKFPNLLSLELQGPNLLNKKTNSHMISEINWPLPKLKYLNLENVLVNTSKTQIQNFVKEFSDEQLTFEYIQKFDSEAHPLTMVQNGANDDILPYEKYKEQDSEHKAPLFIGFKDLLLLRITNCELNNVHWTMFDGLGNLEFLILDWNNLKFIPPFAFYGTPNLKTLSLAHNDLLDIQITDLAGLLELEYLDLTFNNFSQLSELSFAPFPKLKLANFGNNPISAIFPNTFEVMNTTDSLVIGSNDVSLTLMSNSFLGLNLLKALTINNVNIPELRRDLFVGMPNLQELVITGNVSKIEFDGFLEVFKLKKLILNNCRIVHISMDSFMGLEHLEILDLSKNNLQYLPPAVFDQLINIKELYLNDNKFPQLPKDIFSNIHARLIRLNGNPWHCSCKMSEWKPMIVNRIRQKIIKSCDSSHDKGLTCASQSKFSFRYAFENKVAPKCASPVQFLNWSVFHVMRRLLKCPEYKPKIKKHIRNEIAAVSTEKPIEKSKNPSKLDLLYKKLEKHTSNKNDIPPIKTKVLIKKVRKTKMTPKKDKNTNKLDNNLTPLIL